jgi:hypothetical protein
MYSNHDLSRALRSVAAGIACLTLAGSAFAGTLYHWTTEEGTYAYTDDKKRIPARYRDQATKRTMKSLRDYERYTPIPRAAEGTYGTRVQARLEGLRDASRPRAVGASPASGGGSGGYVSVGGGGRFGGGTRLAVPVGAGSAGAGEPLVVESFRVRKSDGHQSTRHVQVVRRGDEIISVVKDERNDGPVTPRHRESDFE